MCLLDTELRYLEINPCLAALNGLSVEAHLGRTISEVIPDVAAKVEPLLRGVMKTGKPVLDGVIWAKTQSALNKPRLFQHSYHVVKSNDGVVLGVRCIVRDVTVHGKIR